eukprot:6182792-Pleurochrysis_carterae.AAC.2
MSCAEQPGARAVTTEELLPLAPEGARPDAQQRDGGLGETFEISLAAEEGVGDTKGSCGGKAQGALRTKGKNVGGREAEARRGAGLRWNVSGVEESVAVTYTVWSEEGFQRRDCSKTARTCACRLRGSAGFEAYAVRRRGRNRVSLFANRTELKWRMLR